MKLLPYIILLLSFAVSAQDSLTIRDLQPAPMQHAKQVGHLQNSRLAEVSGMVSSIRNKDVLWVLNDGGGGNHIYAMDTSGKDLGRFQVDGSRNRDWEDMAGFELDGKAWLLIADVGDNSEQRKRGQLYIVAEPDINNDDHRYFLPLYSMIKFTYEDGPRDCEAIAVDARRRKILLLSKRNVPPRLYELPLDMATRVSYHTAHLVSTVKTIPLPTMEDIRKDPRFGPFGSQPTAMDISRDGSFLLVLTYLNAFIYPFNTDWKSSLDRLPLHVPIPKLEQTEAACFGPDGNTVYVTTEQRPAPLFQIHP